MIVVMVVVVVVGQFVDSRGERGVRKRVRG